MPPAGNIRDPNNPLGPEDVLKLQRASAKLEEAKQIITSAHNCGIDCRAYQALVEALQQRIDAMRSTWGDGGKKRR